MSTCSTRSVCDALNIDEAGWKLINYADRPFTLAAIASVVGVSRTTVWRDLQVSDDYVGASDLARVRAYRDRHLRRMHDELGMSIRAIASLTGWSVGTVHRVISGDSA